MVLVVMSPPLLLTYTNQKSTIRHHYYHFTFIYNLILSLYTLSFHKVPSLLPDSEERLALHGEVIAHQLSLRTKLISRSCSASSFGVSFCLLEPEKFSAAIQHSITGNPLLPAVAHVLSSSLAVVWAYWCAAHVDTGAASGPR